MNVAHRAGRRVRVSMPALNLVPGGMGGTETYAANLTRELAEAGIVDVTSILPSGAEGALPATTERIVCGVRIGDSTVARIGALAAAEVRARGIRRLMSEADVVHYPFTAMVPTPPARLPFVTTLHDVQHLDLPELFTRADFAYRERYYHRAARRAELVITISEFAKRTIVERIGIEADRVRVIPLGVDRERFVPSRAPRQEFALYPARGWPHKNHRRLIEAVELVRRWRPGFRLVLTGGALGALGELPDWVERRGLVPDAELRELYRRAAVLAYPSLYEGFGLPPLEAMASGCPVAASNAGSIPEVCGDAAVLFDPYDVEAIAAGIRAAIERTDRLAELGLAHVEGFTWQRCAEAHTALYIELADR
ncbi:glycosyltransferase family 4 protein [Agromyces archimandritae]|uniref:Glycosyltransferase family 4 protein n=1 Tax=Agromyces archimandritae TaxID=2781962 RepID=A0A975FQC3_9MICO|nr:glycosyltransferase family 1 protein [Agromyces archimandritae]QTX05266.1 glycosyltransferase family 4 protein [Agromyces archimandritae]